MPALVLFALTAAAEIAGCYAVWTWARQGASALWLVPALICLAAFAGLLSHVDSAFAGRAFAAYGGVYVAASLLWMWLAERQRPDLWDLAGGAVCLAGTAIILLAPRAV